MQVFTQPGIPDFCASMDTENDQLPKSLQEGDAFVNEVNMVKRSVTEQHNDFVNTVFDRLDKLSAIYLKRNSVQDPMDSNSSDRRGSNDGFPRHHPIISAPKLDADAYSDDICYKMTNVGPEEPRSARQLVVATRNSGSCRSESVPMTANFTFNRERAGNNVVGTVCWRNSTGHALKRNEIIDMILAPPPVAGTFWQKIASSRYFEIFTSAIVYSNTIWLGYCADYNLEPVLPKAKIHFQIIENIFLSCYFAEMVIRFKTYEDFRSRIADTVGLFDALLVVTMIFETWVIYLLYWSLSENQFSDTATIATVLRGFRIARICRVTRVIRSTPSLMILFSGITAAVRKLFWTMVLLVIVVYVWALCCRLVVGDMKCQYFTSMSSAMFVLAYPGLFPGHEFIAERVLKEVGFPLFFLYTAFVIATVFVFCNLILGILLQEVFHVTNFNKEAFSIARVKSELCKALILAGLDEDAWIDWNEFLSIFEVPQAMAIVEEVGVEVAYFTESAKAVLFEGSAFDGGKVTFKDIVQLILEMRETKTASAKDIMDLKKSMLELNPSGVGVNSFDRPTQRWHSSKNTFKTRTVGSSIIF